MKTKKGRNVFVQNFEDKVEKIKQSYIQNNIRLTPLEEEMRIRFEAAFTLLCNYHSNEQAVGKLMSQFGYSRRSAYYDLRSAVELFGDVVKTKKEASRYILYEMAMKNYQLAASAAPPDIDQMNKALANLVKITGVDKDEFDLPDPSKIQPPVMVLQLSPDFVNSIYAKVIDNKAKKEVNRLIKQINTFIGESQVKDYLDTFKVIDIPHEEMDEH